MVNIAVHIEKLLTKHECVIIHGLGGFISYKENSRIKNMSLSAPRFSVKFNSLLSYQDGLLAESVMREEKISYEAALSYINDEVAKIKNELSSDKIVTFGRIGQFYLVDRQTIAFQAMNSDFLPENLCRPNVYLKKLDKPQEHTDTERKSIIISFPKPSAAVKRYAAVFIALFTLSLFIPNKNSENIFTASFLFDSIEQSNARQEAYINDIVVANNNIIDTTRHNITDSAQTLIEKEIIEPQANEPRKRFHLIIASLPNKASAERYMKEQTKFDADALAVLEKDGKFRISARDFVTRKEALIYLDSIKQKTNAWILCD